MSARNPHTKVVDHYEPHQNGKRVTVGVDENCQIAIRGCFKRKCSADCPDREPIHGLSSLVITDRI